MSIPTTGTTGTTTATQAVLDDDRLLNEWFLVEESYSSGFDRFMEMWQKYEGKKVLVNGRWKNRTPASSRQIVAEIVAKVVAKVVKTEPTPEPTPTVTPTVKPVVATVAAAAAAQGPSKSAIRKMQKALRAKANEDLMEDRKKRYAPTASVIVKSLVKPKSQHEMFKQALNDDSSDSKTVMVGDRLFLRSFVVKEVKKGTAAKMRSLGRIHR